MPNNSGGENRYVKGGNCKRKEVRVTVSPGLEHGVHTRLLLREEAGLERMDKGKNKDLMPS